MPFEPLAGETTRRSGSAAVWFDGEWPGMGAEGWQEGALYLTGLRLVFRAPHAGLRPVGLDVLRALPGPLDASAEDPLLAAVQACLPLDVWTVLVSVDESGEPLQPGTPPPVEVVQPRRMLVLRGPTELRLAVRAAIGGRTSILRIRVDDVDGWRSALLESSAAAPSQLDRLRTALADGIADPKALAALVLDRRVPPEDWEFDAWEDLAETLEHLPQSEVPLTTTEVRARIGAAIARFPVLQDPDTPDQEAWNSALARLDDAVGEELSAALGDGPFVLRRYALPPGALEDGGPWWLWLPRDVADQLEALGVLVPEPPGT